MSLDPSKVVWDAPDPNAVKWDTPKSKGLISTVFNRYYGDAEQNLYLQSAADLLGGAFRGAGSIGSTIVSPLDKAADIYYGDRNPTLNGLITGKQPMSRNEERRRQIDEGLQNLLGSDPKSWTYAGGKLAGEMAGTAGVGPLMAGGARAIPVLARFAPALEAGGLGGRSVGNFGTRTAAGAAVGGASALALNPADTGTGAMVGGALPGVGKVVGLVKTPASYVYDVLAGKIAQVNAGNMLRQAAGDYLPGIQAANAANPNALASTAAAEAANPTYQSMLRIGEAKDPANVAFYANQKAVADEAAALQRAAGGATATESRTVRERTKDALDEITRPMRERALELAGIGGRRGRALQGEAAQASAASKLAAEDVRRFGKVSEDLYFPYRNQPRAETPAILGGARSEAPGVQERANEWARNWTSSTGAGRPAGMPIPPVGATYPGELAARAEQTATRRAGESLAAGETRREAELRMASLKAAGLQPLRPDSILQGIRSKLATPEGGINENSAQVLTRVEKMLTDWTNQHGDITPEALYAIRKWGVSSAVDSLLASADPVAKKKIAAQVIAEVNPLIDDAIEKAGGKGWGDYTRTYAEGMRDIERKTLLSKAMQLYDSSPAQFRKLIEGNDPDTVESILGPGSYDIVQELQGQLGPLQKVVEGIKTRTLVSEKAKAGASAASDILKANLLNKHIPNFLSPKVAITNAVLSDLQGKVNAKTLKALITASQSGGNANEVLAMLPASERVKLFTVFSNNPALRNWLRAGVSSISINALTEQ